MSGARLPSFLLDGHGMILRFSPCVLTVAAPPSCCRITETAYAASQLARARCYTQLGHASEAWAVSNLRYGRDRHTWVLAAKPSENEKPQRSAGYAIRFTCAGATATSRTRAQPSYWVGEAFAGGAASP
jgi:hypothetical protein